MGVSVTPTTFTMVEFDHAALTGVATRLVTEVGLPATLDVVVEVVEQTPAARVTIESIDPLRITAEGGAFEDPKRPRSLGEHRVVDVLGLLLHQVRDRLDPAFGAPALDEKVSLPHRVAWDAYAAFDRLWSATDLTWERITALSDAARAAAPAPTPG